MYKTGLMIRVVVLVLKPKVDVGRVFLRLVGVKWHVVSSSRLTKIKAIKSLGLAIG